MKQKEIDAWRLCRWLMDSHESRAKEKGRELTDAVELPKSRDAWSRLIAMAFDQGYCAGIREHDILELAVKKHLDKSFDDTKALADKCEDRMRLLRDESSHLIFNIKDYLCLVGVAPESLPQVSSVLQCRGWKLGSSRYEFLLKGSDCG